VDTLVALALSRREAARARGDSLRGTPSGTPWEASVSWSRTTLEGTDGNWRDERAGQAKVMSCGAVSSGKKQGGPERAPAGGGYRKRASPPGTGPGSVEKS